MSISILITLLATISFFELSNVNAQNTIPAIDKLTNQGITVAKSGNYAAAIEQFDRALVINSTNIIAMNNKGLALDALGKPEEAIDWYDKALAADGNNTSIMYNKANALSRLGNHTEAMGLYFKSQSLNTID